MTTTTAARFLKVRAGHHRYDFSVLVRNLEAAATFFAWIIDALIPQVLTPRSLGVRHSSVKRRKLYADAVRVY